MYLYEYSVNCTVESCCLFENRERVHILYIIDITTYY